ncbi:hypothetical protein TrRE_jg4848 [Triparma retinervis]|uniref:BART domain-containing protein n=1 Tax=Triparma retinervis TaxID=2557542 RepID=A0A9W7DR92_9STRA|nr:hypothetical protein TrRE_jg4848 [Triparma retinervis]
MTSTRTAALLLSVARHCLSVDLLSSWETFMAEKEPVFLSLPPEEDSEYSLDFTKVHEEFEEIVQSQIGAFLEVEGVSMAEFGEMLVNARNIPAGDSEESSQAAAFVELLVGLVEFRAFVDIMRSRDKRNYYFQILKMWRSSLK